MEESDLFTVNVFRVSEKASDHTNSDEPAGSNEHDKTGTENMDLIERYHNMISARVFKGRMIELEHSKLAGPTVKFKTVVNFDRALEHGHSLGVALIPQDRYIIKSDDTTMEPAQSQSA